MKLYPASTLIIVLLATASCDDDYSILTPMLVKEWTVPMSDMNELHIPALSGTGSAVMRLYSDNSFSYTLTVNTVSSNDVLLDAHLHAGDVITSGPAILPLEPTFTGNTATGTIKGLRQSLVDSLRSDANEIYINLYSEVCDDGLVRGQLNKTIDWATWTIMDGSQVVPSVTNDDAAMAIFRLTTDKKLYAIITEFELWVGFYSIENWTSASIHLGKVGTNGRVLMGIYSNAAEFGIKKIIPVSDAMIDSLKTYQLYLNIPSIEHPDGAIRGQIFR